MHFLYLRKYIILHVDFSFNSDSVSELRINFDTSFTKRSQQSAQHSASLSLSLFLLYNCIRAVNGFQRVFRERQGRGNAKMVDSSVVDLAG